MLIDFVDKYLGKQVSLFKRMKAGHEEKIAFQNLWMLFDTGDTIYCPRREEKLIFDDHSSKAHYVPQAFRVLGCRGGLPLVKTMAPKHAVPDKADIWDMSIAKMLMLDANHLTDALQMPSSQSKKHAFSPLYVVCFNVDFDGVKYGTVREVFMFKPFNGLVGIRDLEAYPVQFLQIAAADPGSPSNQAEVDILVERGRKFIDATKVAHLSYDGLTVGKSREEISSAVMVDFKLAFSEYKDSFQDPDSVVPQFTTLIGPWPYGTDGETYEIYKSTCDDLWCHQEECLVDPYTDFQEDQVEKIEPKVKLLLEEYETGALQEKEGLEEFKEYMEKHDLIRLLPGMVPGFALRRRKWVQLDLSQLMPLEQGDDWNKLVLPPGHREMVQAMVETHARGSQDTQQASKNNLRETEMDLVRGKGKGCIILLHGVPGVGKTSTAECVAAYTERPLYPITCGDIGYVPQDVEHNMERHFKLAHKWGCVLLLDEADVFLAKRNKTDVKRNGLVSVFLRILEYYSGILFLTTNRVGAIDDAFRSRLHLTLYYPKLSRKQTNKIWKNNIDRVKTISEERRSRGQLPITYDKKKIMKWVEINWEVLQWNGRQIRNAFQTALALSEFAAKHSGSKGKMSSPKEPVLDVSHFRLIADATTQFNEYLYSVHGGDEEDMAVRDKLRQENFAPMVKLKDVPISSSSSSSDDSSDKDSDDDETEGESDTRKRGKKGKKKVKSQKEKQKQKEKEKKKSKTKKTSKRQSKSSTEDTGEDNEPESEG
ncbi:hypothetical protein AK830_g6502 [Neonectria ditissima]|uniref:AAA+ ATPase domain-containing protein n=1 Tax=Neonectria ditissima TaxID=78410 RepID=A0A0P7B1V7_9HYPO|nr:hypothetical protein AK830_g6502 [Neonectria ditissima]